MGMRTLLPLEIPVGGRRRAAVSRVEINLELHIWAPYLTRSAEVWQCVRDFFEEVNKPEGPR
jgi:hypothetical protein